MESYVQLSLFSTESNKKASERPCASKKKKDIDPSRAFDERMERFLHYMDTKGMDERWIETCPGELKIIIDVLADYYDIASKKVIEMEGAYAKAAWEYQLQRIKEIQAKLENSTGYIRDKQLEICMKKKPKMDDDIGEDALVLAAKKG